jgi:hypothetical protein
MIRKLELNLNGTCSRSCEHNKNQVQARFFTPKEQQQREQRHIELAPQVCKMWKNDLKMNVSFVQTRSESRDRWLRYWHTPAVPALRWTTANGCFAHAMTDLLRALDRPESEPEP